MSKVGEIEAESDQVEMLLLAAAAGQAGGGKVSAARLSRRLAAIKRALEDLPGQARRLARLQARRAQRQPPVVKPPLRPNPPSGYRQKPQQEIDWLLWECHLLAVESVAEDTS